MSIEENICKYLRDRGIHDVWINGAMEYIGRALNGNGHFVTQVTSIRLRKRGHLKDGIGTLALEVKAELPDAGKTASGSIVYSFSPKRAKAHRVIVILA